MYRFDTMPSKKLSIPETGLHAQRREWDDGGTTVQTPYDGTIAELAEAHLYTKLSTHSSRHPPPRYTTIPHLSTPSSCVVCATVSTSIQIYCSIYPLRRKVVIVATRTASVACAPPRTRSHCCTRSIGPEAITVPDPIPLPFIA